jgi:kumamolisin
MRPHRADALRCAVVTLAVAVFIAGLGACTVHAQSAKGRGATVRLVMPLTVDAAALRHAATEVSTPGTAQYGHYESIATVARRFGASEAARAHVLTYLKDNGAITARLDVTGLFAVATMSRRDAERLFAPQPSAIATRAAARFATSEVRIPDALAGDVKTVIGLGPNPRLESSARVVGTDAAKVRAADTQPTSQLQRTGTAAGCPAGSGDGEINNDPATAAFTPNQYLDAYGFNLLQAAGVSGQGVKVALIEADSVKRSDVAAFANCFGLRVPPIRQFAVGGQRRPTGAEAVLDAEVLDAAAPGLSAIDVYETKPDLTDLLSALTAPLKQAGGPPAVISVSLGLCEPRVVAALGKAGLETSQLELQAATLAGVTIVAASGDDGSAGCVRPNGVPQHRRAVLYPASSWWVTAVGGSNLDLASDNEIEDEFVWNDAGVHLGAGGGGLSSIWTRPPDQSDVVSVNSRAVPDISMLADLVPGYAIYCTAPHCAPPGGSGPWIRSGGTSAAAPLFAGGVALVDQELASNGYATVGDVDTLLYAVGESPVAAQVFNDILGIGNDIGPFIPGFAGQPLGCCTATTGYDQASGLGSVNVAALGAVALAVAPHEYQRLGTIAIAVPAGQHPVQKRAIAIRVKCSQACYATAMVTIRIGNAAPFTVYATLTHVKPGRAKTLTLRLSTAQVHQLASAIAAGKHIQAAGYGIIARSSGSFEKYSPPDLFTIRG